MSGFSPTFTRLGDPAWRELRRSGHRRCVGDLASALAWFDGARLTGQSLAITFVTVGELTSWTLRRNWERAG
jgi:hypothetical protein